MGADHGCRQRETLLILLLGQPRSRSAATAVCGHPQKARSAVTRKSCGKGNQSSTDCGRQKPGRRQATKTSQTARRPASWPADKPVSRSARLPQSTVTHRSRGSRSSLHETSAVRSPRSPAGTTVRGQAFVRPARSAVTRKQNG